MIRPRTLVYIAGPFSPTPEQKDYLAGITVSSKEYYDKVRRALVDQNIERAARLGLQVAKLGAYPVVPHSNTALPEFEDAQPYDFWIEGTAELLRRCDAVLFTSDWQDSSGARSEERLACEIGLPRFYALSDLACWLLPGLALKSGEVVPVLDTPANLCLPPSPEGLTCSLPAPPRLPTFAPETNLANPHELSIGSMPSGARVVPIVPEDFQDGEETRPDIPALRTLMNQGAAQ